MQNGFSVCFVIDAVKNPTWTLINESEDMFKASFTIISHVANHYQNLIIYSDCKKLKEAFLDPSMSPLQQRFEARTLNALIKYLKVEVFSKFSKARTHLSRRASSYRSNGQLTGFAD